jgi:gas vesicle protein
MEKDMNRLPNLNDDELHGTLLNALVVAADKYRDNAKAMRGIAQDAGRGGASLHPDAANRLADQFDEQERKTRALVEKLQEESVDA